MSGRPSFRALVACVSLLLVGFLSAPRAAAGPLTANGTQPPLVNALVAPDNCEGCHGDFDPAHNIEPYPTWAGSMMAQSARDPLFWASLDVANHDVPTVGDFCLRCHAPRGWLAGRSEPPDGSEDGCGLVGKIDAPSGDDFSGVACEFCHRMKVNPNPPSGELSVYEENGQFWIDEDSCNGSPCRYGPYDYPKDGTDLPLHAWAYSPYHQSSQFCGNCHNVTHPTKNLVVAGSDTGTPFPIERTYREWQQSDYASTASSSFASCQSCHMPNSEVPDAKVCSVSTNTHTGDLPVHEFAGGNAWIPEVLRLEYPGLDIDADLAASRDAAVRMLTHAAKLELTVVPEVDATQTLPIHVKVTNLAGHKLPSGYPEGRRMWLSVSVHDKSGKTLLDSGAYDAATGTLTQDPDIKIYQAQVGVWNFNGDNKCDVADANGKPLFHFALNDCVLSDNRIPPAGFTGGQDIETRPVGYTYPETSPGSGVLVNYDVTDYGVVVPAAVTSPLTVDVALRYQTTSREYVEFLRDQAVANNFPADCIQRVTGAPTKSRGELLYDMWQNDGRSAPVDMATATASVIVNGATGAGGAAGASGAAGAAGTAGMAGAGGAGATGGAAGTDAGADAGGTAGASGTRPAASRESGGCGCEVAGGHGDSLASVLLLAGLALVGRRRRSAKD